MPEVRLLDEDKTMLGVYPTSVALQQAMVKDVDLVMISETANPPLCRLMDYSKYKYEKMKIAKEARRKQRAARCVLVILLTEGFDLGEAVARFPLCASTMQMSDMGCF